MSKTFLKKVTTYYLLLVVLQSMLALFIVLIAYDIWLVLSEFCPIPVGLAKMLIISYFFCFSSLSNVGSDLAKEVEVQA